MGIESRRIWGLPPIAASLPEDHDVAMHTRNPVRYRAFGTRRWLPRGRQARRSRGLLLGGGWLRWRVWKPARDVDDDFASGVGRTRSGAVSLRSGEHGSLM